MHNIIYQCGANGNTAVSKTEDGGSIPPTGANINIRKERTMPLMITLTLALFAYDNKEFLETVDLQRAEGFT